MPFKHSSAGHIIESAMLSQVISNQPQSGIGLRDGRWLFLSLTPRRYSVPYCHGDSLLPAYEGKLNHPRRGVRYTKNRKSAVARITITMKRTVSAILGST